MSDTLLSRIVTTVAQTIGDRLPAAYELLASDVLITGDAESHAMPEDATTVRFTLGDEDGFLIVSLTSDAADMLAEGSSVIDALSAVVADVGVFLAPLFEDIPPMVGSGEELPADEALESGPGDAVSVTLTDAGLHRATIGLRMVVTDAMMQALPDEAPSPIAARTSASAAQDGEPAVDQNGMPLDGPDADIGGGPVPLTDAQQVGGESTSEDLGLDQQMQPPGLVRSGSASQRRMSMPSPAQMPLGDAHPADFASFDQLTALPGQAHSMALLGDVEMGVTAELGRTELTVRDVLNLTPGAIIELDRAAGSPVDVVVNGTLIARGEVVVIDEEFGIRITEILGMTDEVNPFPMAQ